MGCNQSHFDEDEPSPTTVDKSQFIVAGLLGEGGFGKVLTGMFVKTGHWFAIKEIKKVSIFKSDFRLIYLLYHHGSTLK